MRADPQPPERAPVEPAGPFRRSLRTWLVLAFASLLLLGTLPVALFTYGRIVALAEIEAAAEVRRASADIGLRVAAMFDPLAVAIGLFRFDPATTAKTEAERENRIPAFLAVLASEPRILAFYVADDRGGMLLVRKVSDALAGTPPEARYAVQSLSSSSRDGGETIRFLAADGSALPGSRVSDLRYDPRERPWYLAAKSRSGTASTEPYRFQSLDVLGVTLARATPAGDAVAAGDMTLDGLQEFLRDRRPTPGSAVLLLGGKGAVIASSDPRTAPALSDAFGRSGEEADLEAAGTQWHAASAPVRIAETAEAWRVVVAIPRTEILAPAASTRDALLWLIPSVVVAAAFLVLAMAGRIARPILALEEAARRICRIDFTPAPRSGSLFLEIERLQTAIETMRGALATFMRYVPADIVRELITSGREAGTDGIRREITVVFSDVRDFTAITEKLPPATVTALLSAYYDRMTRLYKEHEGVVDKFIGDGIMALWNAPAADDDHAVNACRACLAARDAFAAQPLPVPGTERGFVTRFGIHTGEAVVGNVGGAERIQFTAVGANVNLASRIEGLNKVYGTEILVSEAVVRRAGERFEFRRVDTAAPIAGVSDPTAVYELIGKRGTTP